MREKREGEGFLVKGKGEEREFGEDKERKNGFDTERKRGTLKWMGVQETGENGGTWRRNVCMYSQEQKVLHQASEFEPPVSYSRAETELS